MHTADHLRTSALRAPGAFGLGGRLLPVLMGLLGFFALAQPTLAQLAVCPARPGPLPTSGGARPGPIAQILPPPEERPAPAAPEPAQEPAPVEVVPAAGGPVYPVALRIPAAGVDAGIEVLGEIGGVMQNPSGPWVVAWYAYLGTPGVPGNTVMAGHVDYAGVGPAVFAGVGGLGAGSEIVVVGADGQLLLYSVAWTAAFDAAAIGDAELATIIGSTAEESLTLITCTGAFDPASASYSSRLVVRAVRVGSLAAAPAAAAAPAPLAEGDWSFRPGATAEIAADAVTLRTAPSTEAEPVDELAAGTRLRITGRSAEGDGYVWWPVQDATGKRGFVAGPQLTCGAGGDLPASPGAPPHDGTGGPSAGFPHDGTAGPSNDVASADGTAGPPDAATTDVRRAPPDADGTD